MQGLIYNFSTPKYLCDKIYNSLASKLGLKPQFLSLKLSNKLEKPKLINENWVELRSIYSGICGSDLNMLTGNESFSMEPFASFPCVLGHENLAKITKVGLKVKGFNIGDYVIINPSLHCKVRGLEECSQCRQGNQTLCQNFHQASTLSAGMSLGYNSDTSGGWAEYFQAHQDQLIKYNEEKPLELATLVDPLASALRPVLKASGGKTEKKKILIYGAGTIGLLIAYSIKQLGLPWEITLGYRHDFQASLARALVKEINLISTAPNRFLSKAAKVVDATVLPVTLGKPTIIGGFDIVFDCAGSSETLDNSLRLAKAQGEVMLVATANSMSGVDPTPLWHQEVRLTGSCMSGEMIDNHGEKQNIYKLANKLITSELSALISHQFSILDYKDAIKTALNKKKYHSTKVIFSHKGLGAS